MLTRNHLYMALTLKLAHSATVIIKSINDCDYRLFDGFLYESITGPDGNKTCAWRKIQSLRDVVSNIISEVTALGGRKLNLNIKTVIRLINNTEPGKGLRQIVPKDGVVGFKDCMVNVITHVVYAHGDTRIPDDWCTVSCCDLDLETYTALCDREEARQAKQAEVTSTPSKEQTVDPDSHLVEALPDNDSVCHADAESAL